MEKETSRNIRLGFFVSTGMIFLIISIYYIGSKRTLFSRNFKAIAVFNDINGLQTGNNIWFRGMNIGTVKNISMKTDSSVNVELVIAKRFQPFLKKNTVARIATDGLMGNKIIVLDNPFEPAAMIGMHDTLPTLQPIETDEVLRVLNSTSNNLKGITDDLKKITEKINQSNSFWNLLADSALAENLRNTIASIQLTGQNAVAFSADLGSFTQQIKSGKGAIGTLLNDTVFSTELKQTVSSIQKVSDSLTSVASEMKQIAGKINSGEGALGSMLTDTSLALNLNRSIENIRRGSENFNQNMEALKHSFLLRGYFQKGGTIKEKKKKKKGDL